MTAPDAHPETAADGTAEDDATDSCRSRGDAQQRGRFDLKVLEQDSVWVDRAGVVHRLEAMSPTYRANVLHVLELNQDRLYMVVLFDVSEGLLCGDPDATVLRLLANTNLLDGPSRWLESTPLVLRLRTMAA